jgi:PAS domain S-box-containing protein
MTQPVKILMLEDSPIDAEIIQRLLLREKMNCDFTLASNRIMFLQALEIFMPDVILCDHSLPQFNSSEALELVRERAPHIPFIMVTGTVSEEYAANIIKQGADDYILKDRMTRLPSAIEAAIRKRKVLKEIADYKYALDATAIVAITDQKGIITYANRNFCKISKYSPEELIGQDHRIISSDYHSKAYIKELWITIANGKIWHGEFCNRAKDGTLYWVDTTIIPFLNKTGKPYQYLSIRIDISEKKAAERELQVAHERLKFHIENAPLGFIEWDQQLRVKFWSKHAEEIFGWTEREFVVLEKNGYNLLYKEDISQGMRSGELLLAGKLERNSIQLRNNTKDGRVIWCEWFNSVLRDKSGQVITILSLIQDITERKNAEQKIQERQMRLNQSQTIAHLGSWEMRVDALNPTWSDETYRIYGLQPGYDLSVEEWMSYVHPDDVEMVAAKLEKSRREMSDFSMNLRILLKNGSVRHIYSETKYEFNDEGKPLGVVGIIHDITENKIAEEELRESEMRLKEAQAIAHISYWDIDLTTNVHTWSDEFYTILGLEKGSVQPSAELFVSFLHPDEADLGQQRVKQTLEYFTNELFNFRFIRKDGATRYAHTEFRFERDKNGKPVRLFGILQDITEIKKTEEALRQSELRLNEAQAVAHISNWEIDLLTNTHTWSDEYYKIFGWEKNEVQPSRAQFLAPMLPEDVELSLKTILEAHEFTKDSSFSFRFIRKDGTLRYGYAEFKFEVDKKGKPIRIFGILQDVTERRQAEEALKLLQQEVLNQKVQEQKNIARAMIRAQEKERNYLGQELHDNINQILAGTRLYLGMAGNKNARLRELIKYPIELIDSSMEEIRLLTHRLVTPVKNVDLEELVKELINVLTKNTQLKTSFTYAVVNESLSDDLKLNIYRIVQEQTNNILKYAQASNVIISITEKDKIITATIEDDGKGFVVSDKKRGVGLSNMVNRAGTYNGIVDIKSSPGNGCKIIVTLPC